MRIPVSKNYKITCEFNKKGNLWKAGFHTGIDLITSDLNVFSPVDGKLKEIGFDKAYGNYIIIIDIYNNYHWLCHLSSVLIKGNKKVGDKIKEGEYIALMGRTGNATGVHLHYEIRKSCNCYGKVYNPLEYIKEHSNKEKSYSYLKVAFTGSLEDDNVMLSYKMENEEMQFWTNIENVNCDKNTMKIKDTGARMYDNKVLIEADFKEGPKQFWVLEKDLI